ncbi:unnamed protein product [Microthlaspi erraticum]|uniref:RING-CH-type domain-containing protein n=1 Tax=Microthlaspi erraticum TaxID=1685480 RepID=A0A6D2HM62_9BRAS|nr:unnamed protein product [Microthlaspi erraticum]
MEVSPAMIEVGDQGLPAEDVDKDDDEDVCRICRSPEEPGNPLRHPCACRGSIKYVHQDCLRLWLNRRGYKKCEVCGRSYSIVPVYSEDAPERLPCNEFLIGVLLRVARFMKLMFPWIVVILFNSYCNSLHPWGQEIVAEFQRGFWIFRKFASLWAGLSYSCLIWCFMAVITIIRMIFGDLNVRRNADAENFIRNGVEQGAVQVLWKYMKILCDWYFHILIHFLGPPNRLILVPPNAPLDEFGVIRRLLFFLHDDAFAALVFSAFASILFVLLPNWIGQIVLAAVGGSGNSTVICGYMMMLLIPFAYFTLRHDSFPAIVRWFLLRFYSITVELPVFLWDISVKACKNIHVMKDVFVLSLKIGVLPWMIGCWLEICTSPMFGTTISQRFEILSLLPFLNPLYWLAGLCCLIVADSYRELIQELNDFLLVVPRGDRADQNVRPVMQPRFILYSLAEGSMVILHGSQSAEDDIKSQDQRHNKLFQLRIALMLVLAALSMFLFSTAFMALPLLAGRVFFDSISFITTRIGVGRDGVLFFSSSSCLLIELYFLFFYMLLTKSFFSNLVIVDVFAFWIGCHILQAINLSTCFVFDQIQKGRTGLLLKYVFIQIRNGLFFSIWISVIPGLLALLIHLMIIIPLVVPLDESPVDFPVQDWLIGVVVLHIWTFLTMLTPINWFATEAWRRKLERIRDVGINNLPSMWLLRDVIGSLTNTLATTVAIPYLLVKTLFPLLGFSQSINSAAERFIWPALLALITVCFMAKLTRDFIIYLHQLVFNERYLVGERVDNLTEDLESGKDQHELLLIGK